MSCTICENEDADLIYLPCLGCKKLWCEECVHDDKVGDYVCACSCGKLICSECESTAKNNPFVDYDGWRMCSDCAKKKRAKKIAKSGK